jgi:hypothetical protein
LAVGHAKAAAVQKTLEERRNARNQTAGAIRKKGWGETKKGSATGTARQRRKEEKRVWLKPLPRSRARK